MESIKVNISQSAKKYVNNDLGTRYKVEVENEFSFIV